MFLNVLRAVISNQIFLAGATGATGPAGPPGTPGTGACHKLLLNFMLAQNDMVTGIIYFYCFDFWLHFIFYCICCSPAALGFIKKKLVSK